MNKIELWKIVLYYGGLCVVFIVGFLIGAMMNASAKHEASIQRAMFDAAFDDPPEAGAPPLCVRWEYADGRAFEFREIGEGEWKWIKIK